MSQHRSAVLLLFVSPFVPVVLQMPDSINVDSINVDSPLTWKNKIKGYKVI
ncbi:MAG: hypothetical protein ACRC10_06320 [Thermoguttaceae bacterium]